MITMSITRSASRRRVAGCVSAVVFLALAAYAPMAAALSGPPASQASVRTTGASSVQATEAIDYSDPGRWLFLDTTGTAPVDVFYLYPTEYRKETTSSPLIGPIDDPGMVAGAQADLERQASAFDPAGNIYAPYYRQADAAARVTMPAAEHDAVIAGAPTQDAIAAFDYYIDHYNHGRPFILAGHSLGSNVLANLLADYMPRHPDVYRRMVAAYIVGYSITPSYLAANPMLKFAQGAHDTGVIVSWNTEGTILHGVNPVTMPGGIAINPITWTRGETTATAEQNLGSIMLDPARGGRPVLDTGGSFRRYMDFADARVDRARGVVVMSTVSPLMTYFPFGFALGIYHQFDYPFYYYDVRWNAVDRAQRYSGITVTKVTPASPARGTVVAVSAAVSTGDRGAAFGTVRLSFYHRETRLVWARVHGVWKTTRVKYWHYRFDRTVTVDARGRVTARRSLPFRGAWKVVASYSGSVDHNSAASLAKSFTVR